MAGPDKAAKAVAGIADSFWDETPTAGVVASKLPSRGEDEFRRDLGQGGKLLYDPAVGATRAVAGATMIPEFAGRVKEAYPKYRDAMKKRLPSVPGLPNATQGPFGFPLNKNIAAAPMGGLAAFFSQIPEEHRMRTAVQMPGAAIPGYKGALAEAALGVGYDTGVLAKDLYTDWRDDKPFMGMEQLGARVDDIARKGKEDVGAGSVMPLGRNVLLRGMNRVSRNPAIPMAEIADSPMVKPQTKMRRALPRELRSMVPKAKRPPIENRALVEMGDIGGTDMKPRIRGSKRHQMALKNEMMAAGYPMNEATKKLWTNLDPDAHDSYIANLITGGSDAEKVTAVHKATKDGLKTMRDLRKGKLIYTDPITGTKRPIDVAPVPETEDFFKAHSVDNLRQRATQRLNTLEEAQDAAAKQLVEDATLNAGETGSQLGTVSGKQLAGVFEVLEDRWKEATKYLSDAPKTQAMRNTIDEMKRNLGELSWIKGRKTDLNGQEVLAFRRQMNKIRREMDEFSPAQQQNYLRDTSKGSAFQDELGYSAETIGEMTRLIDDAHYKSAIELSKAGATEVNPTVFLSTSAEMGGLRDIRRGASYFDKGTRAKTGNAPSTVELEALARDSGSNVRGRITQNKDISLLDSVKATKETIAGDPTPHEIVRHAQRRRPTREMHRMRQARIVANRRPGITERKMSAHVRPLPGVGPEREVLAAIIASRLEDHEKERRGATGGDPLAWEGY